MVNTYESHTQKVNKDWRVIAFKRMFLLILGEFHIMPSLDYIYPPPLISPHPSTSWPTPSLPHQVPFVLADYSSMWGPHGVWLIGYVS